MFSRSVRTLTGRVLANAVRPTVIPAARQIAPAVAVVARRSYHEKVLDRECSHLGFHSRLFPIDEAYSARHMQMLTCPNIRLLASSQRRYSRQEGQVCWRRPRRCPRLR